MTATDQEGRLADVHISGDFFIYPRSALSKLEQALEGAPMEAEVLTEVVREFYFREGVETPGITPEVLAGVFLYQT